MASPSSHRLAQTRSRYLTSVPKVLRSCSSLWKTWRNQSQRCRRWSRYVSSVSVWLFRGFPTLQWKITGTYSRPEAANPLCVHTVCRRSMKWNVCVNPPLAMQPASHFERKSIISHLGKSATTVELSDTLRGNQYVVRHHTGVRRHPFVSCRLWTCVGVFWFLWCTAAQTDSRWAGHWRLREAGVSLGLRAFEIHSTIRHAPTSTHSEEQEYPEPGSWRRAPAGIWRNPSRRGRAGSPGE